MSISVRIVTEVDLIDNGLRSILDGFPDRVVLARSESAGPADVDIVLWAGFGQLRDVDLAEVRRQHQARRLVVACWDLAPGLVRALLSAGASGYVSTQLSGDDLVSSLEAVARGEVVISPELPETTVGLLQKWPGQADGLSEREADIVMLIARGLTNDQIAGQLFLSINTVKSYIRSAYRKMAVTTRSQAVLWAVDRGLDRRPVGESEGAELTAPASEL